MAEGVKNSGRGTKDKKLQKIVSESIIEAVKKYECLWKTSANSFSDKIAKGNAWKEVKDEVDTELAKGNYSTKLSVEEVQKKWKNLRDSFTRELRNCRVKSGDPGPPPKPKWPFFEVMVFIKDTVQPKETFSNYDEPNNVSIMVSDEEEEELPETGDESFQESSSTSGPSPASSVSLLPAKRPIDELRVSAAQPTNKKKLAPQSAKGKGKKAQEPDYIDLAMLDSLKEIQANIVSKATSEQDPDMSFCVDVASRLRKLSPPQNALAKLRIQEVLYQIEYPVVPPQPSGTQSHPGPAYNFGGEF